MDLSGIEPGDIAHALTMSGLEVEEIEQIGAGFSNIVVAEILEINPHPNADKLQLAKVFNGTEEKEVVCGAKNIARGQFVPYATIGSEVMDRKTGEKFELKPVSIRGVESQGMLCSAEELGLNTVDFQEDDGILILKDSPAPGTDIKKVLNITQDTVLHTAPTANRGDEMSLLGIAREVSALYNRPIKLPELREYPPSIQPDFEVEIKDEDTCKYYAAGVVEDLKIGPSPEWMAQRLIASGVRSINNVVDITNYVMLEYGQPLHAFDLDKLGVNYLCVRRAEDEEIIVTLDEEERKLDTDSVLIATEEKPVGLAGLMGGYNSEVDENTKNIALESAYFTPPTNRKSSRSVGLRTEASARFERGVDIEAVRSALLRAMNLMEEHAGAKIEGIVETGKDKLTDREVTLRFSEVRRVLGIEIPYDRCVQILQNLGFELLGRDTFTAMFKVPSFRANDVTREIDLIEEISRIYGYDKIEPTLPKETALAEISEETKCIKKIHKILLAKGLKEAVTSSLIGEPLLKWIGIGYEKGRAIKVSNPQSEEHTMLRQSLIPSIAQVVKYNLDQGQKNIWIYEIGKTYFFNGNVSEKEAGTQEKRLLAGALTGNISPALWRKPCETDFYTAKGLMELLLKEFNLENRAKIEPVVDVSYFHPGKAAKITLLGKEPVCLGYFGELHPDTADKCKINQPVYLFELDMEKILDNITKTVPRYKQLPQYPAVIRDIAFIASDELNYQEIAKTIKKSCSKLLRSADVFDLYKGEHVPEGKKSMAVRLTLQNPEATLTDEEVNKEVANMLNKLKMILELRK